MKELTGKSGAWNYTIGPAYIWRGQPSIVETRALHLPVVIVAQYIPAMELGILDLTRVLGFVIEEGKLGDPSNVFYSSQHRACVIGAKGALGEIQAGQMLVVDGVNGKVFVDPDAETLAKYEELRKKGPPPEKPGIAAEMMDIAKDLKALTEMTKGFKGDMIDVNAIAGAMGAVVKMYEKQTLTKDDLAGVKNLVGGTPVEEDTMKKLELYQAAITGQTPEIAPAPRNRLARQGG